MLYKLMIGATKFNLGKRLGEYKVWHEQASTKEY